MINIELLISQSIKNHDSVKTNVLRDIKNEILKFKTAKNAKEYNDNAEISILKKLISQHKESIEQFNNANRQDLVEKEQNELDILQALIPEEANEAELIKAMDEACIANGIDINVNYIEYIPKNKMGIIIKYIKDKYPQNDGSYISELVKLHLIK